jgi:hypothetical protein
VDKGKDASELVNKLHDIIDELKELGFVAQIKADYLTKEYWSKKEQSKLENQEPPYTKEPQKKIKPNQDSFILCLAWSSDNNETPEQVSKVEKYFEELALPVLDEDINIIGNRTEHVLRYEFKGSEDAFRLLKICTQFVLDAFAKSDFEKFNIAIYGKKKNY